MQYKVFGCKTNKYFTEKWLEDPVLSDARGVFVASCVVTAKADAKWKRFVRKALETLPDGEKIYLSGCASIKDGSIESNFYSLHQEFQKDAHRIVLLWENPENTEAKQFLHDIHGTSVKINTDALQKLSEARKQGNTGSIYTRKYIVIQTGCDNHCTFCQTIQSRWKHKNRPKEAILEEIRNFAESGGVEVVLTGTNIGAWGSENSNNVNDSRFVKLLEEILETTTIQQLRISSLWVEFLSDRLLSLFEHPRMHAYIHLSIQSAAESILRTMGRHYTREFLIDRLSKIRQIRRSDGVRINLWADLIVGFPGETESDFADTLHLVQEFLISNLHAFPFSDHANSWGIPAAKLPNQIPESIKNARLAELMNAGDAARIEFLQKNDGKNLTILFEGSPTKSKFKGYSQNHIALSEENFTLSDNTSPSRWVAAYWVYRYSELDAARHILLPD